MIFKSKRYYKKGKYFTRSKLKSFKSKPSSHVEKAKKMYNIKKISASNELSKKTLCSKSALSKIINKGQGAYFSSGSRPNQTGQSWGIARLSSSISGGKASIVDYHILKKGCKSKSRALRLANRLIKKSGRKPRTARKYKVCPKK